MRSIITTTTEMGDEKAQRELDALEAEVSEPKKMVKRLKDITDTGMTQLPAGREGSGISAEHGHHF